MANKQSYIFFLNFLQIFRELCSMIQNFIGHARYYPVRIDAFTGIQILHRTAFSSKTPLPVVRQHQCTLNDYFTYLFIIVI